MHIRYDRPVSRSAFFARRPALFSLVMLLIVVLAHRFGPLRTPDFVMLVLAAAVPALLAVPLALLGLARLWQIGALGGIASAWALIYAALPIALPGYGYYLYMTKPPLTEVVDRGIASIRAGGGRGRQAARAVGVVGRLSRSRHEWWRWRIAYAPRSPKFCACENADAMADEQQPSGLRPVPGTAQRELYGIAMVVEADDQRSRIIAEDLDSLPAEIFACPK